VHIFKLGGLADALHERGLARVAESPSGSWAVWVDVETHTADLFMAYLAATLGPLQEPSLIR
jgi:hypothetical protein